MAWYDPAWQFLKDATAPIGETFVAVTDAILPIIRGLPGAKAVEDAINQGADWIKGIVNAPGADIVLKALAMLTYGPVAHALGGIAWFGPQIASAVWALPGVIRGQNFVDAWAFEVKDRFEKLAEYATPGLMERLREQLPDTFRYLNRYVYDLFPNVPLETGLQRLRLTPQQISTDLHVREDVAALALNYIHGSKKYDVSSFDILTGRMPSYAAERVPLPPRGAKLAVLIPLRDRLPGGVSIRDIAAVVEAEKKGVRGTTKKSLLQQLFTLALLTSPIWVPNILLPRLRGRR